MSNRVEQQVSRSDSVAAGAGSRFRSRALDPNRSLPIWMRSDLHQRADYHGQASRAVPMMPSGVDKDEESEYHLRKALEAHSYKQDGNNNLQENGVVGDLSPDSVLKNAEKGIEVKSQKVEKLKPEINKSDKKKIKENGDGDKESGYIPCPGGQIVVEKDRVSRLKFNQGKHFYKHNQVSLLTLKITEKLRLFFIISQTVLGKPLCVIFKLSLAPWLANFHFIPAKI